MTDRTKYHVGDQQADGSYMIGTAEHDVGTIFTEGEAHRIVACLNWFVGVPTEMITGGKVATIRDQRDRLASVLMQARAALEFRHLSVANKQSPIHEREIEDAYASITSAIAEVEASK